LISVRLAPGAAAPSHRSSVHVVSRRASDAARAPAIARARFASSFDAASPRDAASRARFAGIRARRVGRARRRVGRRARARARVDARRVASIARFVLTPRVVVVARRAHTATRSTTRDGRDASTRDGRGSARSASRRRAKSDARRGEGRARRDARVSDRSTREDA